MLSSNRTEGTDGSSQLQLREGAFFLSESDDELVGRDAEETECSILTCTHLELSQ